ncbi:MAG: acyltransferase [Chitinophagaceae bacterium]|nr:MAG: acyltransferase [Chitinophagaceae bacterium]
MSSIEPASVQSPAAFSLSQTGATSAAAAKAHFPILDGLRGVAAFMVIIFHLLEAVYPDYALHPVHHGYLAVDFFFLLSGFVVGYAYDDRWGAMSVKDFFRIRLIRLQPLVVLGVLLGLVVFLIDPYNTAPKSGGLIALTTLLSLLLLPGPDIRGWGETHPLNGPCWSLLQEYIANIAYALLLRKLANKTLWFVVIVCAVALCVTASRLPNIGTGWSYGTFWIATVRMAFPFVAGLLLFRSRRTIRIRWAFPLCALALVVVFLLPAAPRGNGLLDAALVLFIFPAIVAAGAGGAVGARMGRICSLLGRMSYPVYILHYPFIYTYTAWVYTSKPAPSTVALVASGLFVLFVLLAWVALRYFDEPLRAWLGARFRRQALASNKLINQ